MKKKMKSLIKKTIGEKYSHYISKIVKKTRARLYRHNMSILADKMHYNILGRHIDWENPQDLNEKINWLKFNSDTSLWTKLADKYQVREYIKEKGYEDILVPLYGKWDNADDINFESLIYPCVIKPNHGSGDNFVLMNKPSKKDQKSLTKRINHILKTPYGYETAEPHYINIPTCIVAEQFLIDQRNTYSSSLVDYKIWCFNGVPDNTLVIYNRTEHAVQISALDINWSNHPERLIFTDHFKQGRVDIPKPTSYERMLKVASDLSIGFPQVRIDFYEVNEMLFFGEMTFTAMGGYMDYYTHEFLLEMGNKCNLK